MASGVEAQPKGQVYEAHPAQAAPGQPYRLIHFPTGEALDGISLFDTRPGLALPAQ